jgi:hypothetical protein
MGRDVPRKHLTGVGFWCRQDVTRPSRCGTRKDRGESLEPRAEGQRGQGDKGMGRQGDKETGDTANRGGGETEKRRIGERPFDVRGAMCNIRGSRCKVQGWLVRNIEPRTLNLAL